MWYIYVYINIYNILWYHINLPETVCLPPIPTPVYSHLTLHGSHPSNRPFPGPFRFFTPPKFAGASDAAGTSGPSAPREGRDVVQVSWWKNEWKDKFFQLSVETEAEISQDLDRRLLFLLYFCCRAGKSQEGTESKVKSWQMFSSEKANSVGVLHLGPCT